MRAACYIAALVSVITTPAIWANPVVPPDRELREAIQQDALQRRPNHCTLIADRISTYRAYYRLEESTRTLIQQNMQVFEDCILRAQEKSPHFNLWLHNDFRDYASGSAKNRMCKVLRARLQIPTELLVLEDTEAFRRGMEGDAGKLAARRLIQNAEILADYGDQKAIPLLRAAIPILQESPSDTLWSRTNEPISFYLSMALKRIDDPMHGEIVSEVDGRYEILKPASDVARAELSYQSYHVADRAPIGFSDMKFIQRLFDAFESSPRDSVCLTTFRRHAYLDLCFSDDSRVMISAYHEGCISMHVRSRITAIDPAIRNLPLAAEFLELAETLLSVDSAFRGGD